MRGYYRRSALRQAIDSRPKDSSAPWPTPEFTFQFHGFDAQERDSLSRLSGFPLQFERETLILPQSMRILVQNAVSNVYFDGVDWIEDAGQAKDFGSVSDAESFCQEQELSTVLIVVKSKDGCHDVSYPVGDHNAVLVSKRPSTEVRSLC
jgi:hypothetical protein